MSQSRQGTLLQPQLPEAHSPAWRRVKCREGWYLELQHADGGVTRYCHLATAPLVEQGAQVHTGQVIGAVGSSGNSSGPHLHLETHTGHPATPDNAVPPHPVLAIRGVAIT